MVTIPFDSDATRAAVTAAAQAVAAYADRHAITITAEQCEDLAQTLIGQYQAFEAGVRYATPPPSSEPGT
ncbi:hypothetical protein [Phytohabitans kaempferiae]|uniref:Centromere-binding protein ParB C-terminal domain-containing protein n=1 Tax=Phytohabitans kaempferiae TaxID=1620943 RepID=A0ABV6LWH9_9ACTN